MLKSGIFAAADKAGVELCVCRQLRDFRQTEHLPPLVNGLQQILRPQRRDLKVQLQGIAAGLHLRSGSPLRSLKLVLGRVQRASGLPNLIELENGLNLLRALRRLDEDEAENLAAGKHDFRMVGDFRESGFHVVVSGNDLGLLRAKIPSG